MPAAARQVQRNREITLARAAGESIPSLAQRFGLSRSRVKQILRVETGESGGQTSEAVELAVQRRAEYVAAASDLRDLARRLPDTQAAAKVGAYRVLLDALDRLTALERALGFLPDDIGRLRSERALVEAVFAVFVEHDVPVEARRALVAQLGAGEAAA